MKTPLQQQIIERTYSFISEGTQNFPKPAPSHSPLKPPQIPLDITVKPFDITSKISNCSLCPLSQTRKKVVVSSEIFPQKFFILSEFPEKEDENSTSPNLFSDKSSSGLILKLLEKLNILKQSYFSFAVKCVPEKGLLAGCISLCAQSNLKDELYAVEPEVILCFGQRALFALAHIDPAINSTSLSENASTFNFNLEGSSPKRVFFLSSSRDLEAFPPWRNQVWHFLAHFKTAP